MAELIATTDKGVGVLWNDPDWRRVYFVRRLILKLIEERAFSLKNAHGWLAAEEPNHGQTQGRGDRANLCIKCNQGDYGWTTLALQDFGINYDEYLAAKKSESPQTGTKDG